jgi:hypothetical protein
MNKTVSVVVLSFFLFYGTAINFSGAQVPVVPSPTCVDVPGIPCPNHKTAGSLQKPQSPAVPETGESQTFNGFVNSGEWSKRLGGIANQTAEILRNFFDGIFAGAKNFFQNINIKF